MLYITLCIITAKQRAWKEIGWQKNFLYITDVRICNIILSLHPLLMKLKQDNKYIYIYMYCRLNRCLKGITSMLILTLLTLPPNWAPILHVSMKGWYDPNSFYFFHIIAKVLILLFPKWWASSLVWVKLPKIVFLDYWV